jgi:hypothetical protein
MRHGLVQSPLGRFFLPLSYLPRIIQRTSENGGKYTVPSRVADTRDAKEEPSRAANFHIRLVASFQAS